MYYYSNITGGARFRPLQTPLNPPWKRATKAWASVDCDIAPSPPAQPATASSSGSSSSTVNGTAAVKEAKPGVYCNADNSMLCASRRACVLTWHASDCAFHCWKVSFTVALQTSLTLFLSCKLISTHCMIAALHYLRADTVHYCGPFTS
jgi:hypothetical protein